MAVHEGVILGQLGTIQVELCVGAERVDACWLVDFMVRPEYRNRALGALLLRRAGEDFPLCMALGMTDAAERIFRGLKWADLGESSFWWRVLRWKPLLATYSRLAPITSLAGAALDLASGGSRAWRAGRATSAVRAEPVPSIDERFGPWLDEVGRDYGVLAARSVAYLKWRYLEKPGTRYRILAAYRDGDPAGYAVLAESRFRGVLPMGVVLELLTRKTDGEARRALLGAAEAQFRRVGMAIMSCNTTCPALGASLRETGFRSGGLGQRVMVDVTRVRGLAEILSKADNWFLGRGDADGDNGCW